MVIGNSARTSLVVAGTNTISLYSACTASACLNSSCDFNGNCLLGCAASNPPRVLPKCTCPDYYFDNTVNPQCVPKFNASGNFV
jgi:hypothetical protein